MIALWLHVAVLELYLAATLPVPAIWGMFGASAFCLGVEVVCYFAKRDRERGDAGAM